MESRATTRYIHQSPRKMRKTTDRVKGLKVDDALNYLHFSAEKSAKIIEKTLMSAASNFMQKSDNEKSSSQDLFIKEVSVNGGPVMKRFRAASMGRASRLRRPTSHLTIIVTNDKIEVNLGQKHIR